MITIAIPPGRHTKSVSLSRGALTIGATIYIVVWAAIPIFYWGISPIFSPFSLVGCSSAIIFLLGGFYFTKLFAMLYMSSRKNGREEEGEGDGPPPGAPEEPVLITLFLISLSFFICVLILVIFPDKKPTLFDKATLWSAVYGSVLGTIAFLKSFK